MVFYDSLGSYLSGMKVLHQLLSLIMIFDSFNWYLISMLICNNALILEYALRTSLLIMLFILYILTIQKHWACWILFWMIWETQIVFMTPCRCRVVAVVLLLFAGMTVIFLIQEIQLQREIEFTWWIIAFLGMNFILTFLWTMRSSKVIHALIKEAFKFELLIANFLAQTVCNIRFLNQIWRKWRLIHFHAATWAIVYNTFSRLMFHIFWH